MAATRILPTRSVRFLDPREVREILRGVQGAHAPAEGHDGGAWRFGGLLGAIAAIYVLWLVRDLSAGYQLDWRWVVALALTVGAAVVGLFFALKTNTDRYRFEAAEVVCTDHQGRERWRLPAAQIDEVILMRLRRGRVFMVLVDHEQRRYPVHSHESLSRALYEVPVVRGAFER